MEPKSLFSLSDHLEALSKEGDPLDVLQETVDFECSERGWSNGLVMAMEPKADAHPSIR